MVFFYHLNMDEQLTKKLKKKLNEFEIEYIHYDGIYPSFLFLPFINCHSILEFCTIFERE